MVIRKSPRAPFIKTCVIKPSSIPKACGVWPTEKNSKSVRILVLGSFESCSGPVCYRCGGTGHGCSPDPNLGKFSSS